MNQSNRLIHEKSPYLRQHAHNSINWYPWCEEAFLKAKKEDKPIFLSIGYSSCTWCHVMEKESFMDQEVADLLNAYYVAIKVDREERPDIDHVYMEMAQAISGMGGWPLTIVMTPDQVPFFASTYLPKHGNDKQYGLIEILTILKNKWQNQRENIENATMQVKNYAKILEDNKSLVYLDDSIIDEAFFVLKNSFDSQYGGFGNAPKFPTPQNLYFLLRYSIMKKSPEALKMLEKTLMGMYQGGIYDHLASGFSRYSTDELWLVPHFEKMLYDNALLVIAYIETYLHTKNEQYKAIAQDTLNFIEAKFLDTSTGGFYTAIDADSDGVEGKYYLWSYEELKTILTAEEFALLKRYSNIASEGHFNGQNILNLLQQPSHLDEAEFTLLQSIKAKLLQIRNERSHPQIDKKILTANNAMMIIALIHAYNAFNESKYLEQAVRTTDFILESLIDAEGRLLARYMQGEVKYLAYSSDYAYLIWALIELFLATSKVNYIEMALKLNQDLYERYYDQKRGGYFHTAHDGETLLFRFKETYDGAIPSANAVITMNLIRLAEIVDEPKFESLAYKQFQTFAESIMQAPKSHIYMIAAYIMYKVAKRKIVLVIKEMNDEVAQLQRIVRSKCIPCTQMLTLYYDEIKNHEIFSYYIDESAPYVMHICENYSCNEPLYDFTEMAEALNNLILAKLS